MWQYISRFDIIKLDDFIKRELVKDIDSDADALELLHMTRYKSLLIKRFKAEVNRLKDKYVNVIDVMDCEEALDEVNLFEIYQEGSNIKDEELQAALVKSLMLLQSQIAAIADQDRYDAMNLENPYADLLALSDIKFKINEDTGNIVVRIDKNKDLYEELGIKRRDIKEIVNNELMEKDNFER